MPNFREMNRTGRRRFLRRKARKFGYAPPEIRGRLTPRKAREVNRAMKRQYWDTGDWATQPMTRRNALAEARAVGDLKYNPALRELREELQKSQGQHGTIDVGFDLYTKKLQDIQNRARQLYTGATAQVFNQANTMAGQEAQNLQQANQEAQASADVRGATPSDRPSEVSGQASRARQIFGTSFGGLLATHGTSEGGRLLEQERIGERQRISEHARELAYARKLKRERRDIKSDRGDLVRAQLGELREGERRYRLERKAFGLERKAQKAEIKDAKRDDRRALLEAYLDAKAERRDDIRQRLKDRWDMTDDQIDNALDRRREDRMERQGGGGSDDGPTGAAKRANRADWANALELAQRVKRNDPKANVADTVTYLVEKGNFDLVLAKAAANQVFRGGVRPKRARKIRNLYPGARPNVKRGGQSFGGLTDPIDNPLGQFGD